MNKLLPVIASCFLSSISVAQDIASRALTDAIYRGDGVINLLKDINGSDLAQYLSKNNGMLFLGADINEDNSGNESSSSLGVAIKQVQLTISTTTGDFTFGDFYTSTSSMLREYGSTTSSEYFTMFGQGGSSQITGSTNFDLSSFDDVMWLEKIVISGEIIRAELGISFVETPRSRMSSAESFFDFSGGFEDFALLSTADAMLLEEAYIGISAAPPEVSYATAKSAAEAISAMATPPAAPAPPIIVILGIVGLLLFKLQSRSKKSSM